MSLIRTAYKKLITQGALAADAAQKAAVDALARLEWRIRSARGLRGALGFGPRTLGLYLYGPPGRGKSMMMDLFFKHAKDPLKKRVHFHAFMQEVHHDVHIWRQGTKAEKAARFGTHRGEDPIPPIAKRIAREARLLCFDEFQVSDIADAMILGRLFEALLAQKVMIMITSNRAPDALYKDGLNRDRFLPFIELIKSRLEVHEIKGPKDFRMDRLKGATTYFFPSTDQAARAAFDALWADMSALNEERAVEMRVNERTLRFDVAAGPLLKVSFADLCAKANGAADYLAVAERFTTVFLSDIPIMGPHNRNEAKRFVTLIDALYEEKTLLVALAEAEPSALYPKGDGAFEFERTVSRLEEMRSESYINQKR